MKLMNKKLKSLIYLGILIMTIFVLYAKLLTPPKYFLVIQDRNSNKKWTYKLQEKNFSIGYKHSVMKTEAEEFFKIDSEGNIILWETVYKSYGVGLPFLPEEGELKIEDGKFILKMERKFKDINMTISPLAKHYLRVNNKKYMLSEELGEKVKSIKLKINIKGWGV